MIVDMSGTYLDKPGGPFTPGAPIERKKYRMLAGVVTTKQLGNYFFKFYGPEKDRRSQRRRIQKNAGFAGNEVIWSASSSRLAIRLTRSALGIAR